MMYGVLVSLTKGLHDKVMNSISSALYYCHDIGISDVTIVVHTDTYQMYMKEYHEQVVKDFSGVVNISKDVYVSKKVPGNHVWFAERSSVASDRSAEPGDSFEWGKGDNAGERDPGKAPSPGKLINRGRSKISRERTSR